MTNPDLSPKSTPKDSLRPWPTKDSRDPASSQALECARLGAEVVAWAAEGFAAAPAGLARLPLAVVACGGR